MQQYHWLLFSLEIPDTKLQLPFLHQALLKVQKFAVKLFPPQQIS